MIIYLFLTGFECYNHYDRLDIILKWYLSVILGNQNVLGIFSWLIRSVISCFRLLTGNLLLSIYDLSDGILVKDLETNTVTNEYAWNSHG